MIALLLLGCTLVGGAEKRRLLDPDGDGSDWPDDCDGSDPEIHPGVAERCDGEDQDCDGQIDEDAADAVPWYADQDGDGQGDPATESLVCDDPGSGWARDVADCDDGDATVYSGAEAVCGDRRVNDCQGTPAAEGAACTLAGTQKIAHLAELDAVSVVTDDPDAGTAGFGEILIGAGGTVLGSADIEHHDGLFIGAPKGDGLVAAAWWAASPWPDSETYDADANLELAIWTGQHDQNAGAAIASIGAVCGVNTLTWIIGAPGEGLVTLLSMPDALSLEGPLAEAEPLGTLSGPVSFGNALGAEGQVEEATVVIGAVQDNSAGFLVLDSRDDCLAPESAWQALDTPDGAEDFGETVAGGDLTGDGVTDLLISAADDDGASLWYFDGSCRDEADCGERLDPGPMTGRISAIQIIDLGGSARDACQPDGILDLIVGAEDSGTNSQGQVMVLEGSHSSAPAFNPDGLGVRTGEEEGDRLGASLLVDSNTLGADAPTAILLAGAPGVELLNANDAPDDGVVYGWLGTDAWCGASTSLDPSFLIEGIEGSNLGKAMTKLHNFDWDPEESPEFALGAPGVSGGAGAVYIVPLMPY